MLEKQKLKGLCIFLQDGLVAYYLYCIWILVMLVIFKGGKVKNNSSYQSSKVVCAGWELRQTAV